MSAIAMVCTDTCIAVAGDAVAYEDDGIIRRFAPKVIAMPDMSMVLANVGAGGYAAMMEEAIRDTGALSLDEALPLIVQLARLTLMRHMVHHRRAATATLALGGWSHERGRFETYKIHSHTKLGTGADGTETIAEPWTLHPAPIIWASNGGYDLDALLAAGIDLNARATAPDYAVKLVCAARLLSHPPQPDAEDGDDREAYAVGGWVQVTTLERDAAYTRIAHRWPDKIGEQIDPMAGTLGPLAA